MFFYFKMYFFSLLIICLAIGLWFSQEIENVNLSAPNKTIGEFPAIFEGRITNILKNDSNHVRLIVRGNIDTKFLPETKNTGILLNIYGYKIREYNLKEGFIISAKVNTRLPNRKILRSDFDEHLYCASMDVQWIGRAKIEDISIIEDEQNRDIFSEIKEQIGNKISDLFDDNSMVVVNAIILGDKSLISSELREVYSLSGTAHLLAVSGLHVGIIAFCIFFLLSFVRQKWLRFIIFAVLTVLYVIVSGLQESAIRAGFMSILVVYLTTIERQIYPLNIAAFVFLLLLLIKPSFIFSPGFQMSFASIAGIILFFSPTKNLLKLFVNNESSLVDKVLSSFALTISASLIVSPVVAYYFGVYSFVSPLSNLIVVPLMSLALVFGIISVALSFVSFQIAEIYALTTDLMLNLSEHINRFFISLPFAYWKNIENLWVILLISIILLYIVLSKSRKHFIFRSTISILILLMSSFLLIPKNGITIIPRDKYVILITNDQSNEKLILIIDRKPHQRYAYDSGLIKFIQSTDKDIIIAYNGLAGSAIIDKIKEIRKIKIIELNNESVRLLKKILGLREHIPKII